MDYYHVLVAFGSSSQLQCILWDLDEKGLKKSFVQPFLRGDGVLAQGRIYRPAELNTIRIRKTAAPADTVLARLKEENNRAMEESNRDGGYVLMPPVGYSKNDLEYAGDDVTAQVLPSVLSDGGYSGINAWLAKERAKRGPLWLVIASIIGIVLAIVGIAVSV